MEHNDNSIMVVLDQDEYCFLYDSQSLPELLESILEQAVPETGPRSGGSGLCRDEACEIARGLIGQVHQGL